MGHFAAEQSAFHRGQSTSATRMYSGYVDSYDIPDKSVRLREARVDSAVLVINVDAGPRAVLSQ